jgi:hypothetical protein
MTVDEHEDKEPSSEQDKKNGTMPSPTEEELFGSDLETFLVALNQFSHLADQLEWPDSMPLDKDLNIAFRAFKMYWRQRIRQRRQSEQHDSIGQENSSNNPRPNMKDFQRFFRSRIRFDYTEEEEEDETVFIDPGEHQPDEEPKDEAAQRRDEDFREKWE